MAKDVDGVETYRDRIWRCCKSLSHIKKAVEPCVDIIALAEEADKMNARLTAELAAARAKDGRTRAVVSMEKTVTAGSRSIKTCRSVEADVTDGNLYGMFKCLRDQLEQDWEPFLTEEPDADPS